MTKPSKHMSNTPKPPALTVLAALVASGIPLAHTLPPPVFTPTRKKEPPHQGTRERERRRRQMIRNGQLPDEKDQ